MRKEILKGFYYEGERENLDLTCLLVHSNNFTGGQVAKATKPPLCFYLSFLFLISSAIEVNGSP